MNVLELIKDDHRRVRELIRRLRAGNESPEAARRLFGGLRNALERHMEAEEACFYPAIDVGEDELIDEAAAEHEGVHELLADLGRMSPGTYEWSECLEDLEEMIEAHVEMEEVEIFAIARRKLDLDQLDLMAQEFKSLTTPRASHEQPDVARDRLDPYVRE